MKISVVIPLYNCERFVKRCIESVKAQTYPDWECIVVDDGSQDGGLQLVSELTKGDRRFGTIRLAKNCGVGVARNIGIDISSGDGLFFLDADDWMEPHLLSGLVEEHRKHPEMGRIFTPPIVHRESDGSIYVWGFVPKGMHGIESKTIFRDAKCDPGHCTGSLYVLSNIRGKYNFRFDERMNVIEDLLFNIGLHFAGITTFITDWSAYHYHRHSGTLVTAFPYSYKDAENANRTIEELRERYNPPNEVFIACRRHLNDIIARQLSKIIYK